MLAAGGACEGWPGNSQRVEDQVAGLTGVCHGQSRCVRPDQFGVRDNAFHIFGGAFAGRVKLVADVFPGTAQAQVVGLVNGSGHTGRAGVVAGQGQPPQQGVIKGFRTGCDKALGQPDHVVIIGAQDSRQHRHAVVCAWQVKAARAVGAFIFEGLNHGAAQAGLLV